MATRYEPPVAAAAKVIRLELERLGYRYVQPPWEEAFAAKGPFLLTVKYDPRDCAWVTFGRQDADIDSRFFPTGIDWNLQRPFEAWLQDVGNSPKPFVEALGGWVTGGLQTPDFGRLGALIVSSLAEVEKCASS